METIDSYTLLHRIVLHLPVVTTLCAIFFCASLFRRYRAKGGGLHLLWWGIGMATYGIGTFTEATTTIAGWNPTVFRLWYISGAFLGGYPLAQGSIYLLTKRRFAHASAIVVSTVIAVGAVLVWIAPLDPSLAEGHRLSGEVIEWQWVRLMTPFVNVYSLIFLVGGAIVSALRFRKAPALRHRYLGNIWIAVGALLPGIGGSLTRAGFVEALYVTELVGLIFIWVGYRLNVREKKPTLKAVPRTVQKAAVLALLALTVAAPAVVSAEDAAADATVDEEVDEEVDATPPDDLEHESVTGDDRASFYAETTVTARGRETEVLETATPVLVLEQQEIERRMPETPVDLLRDEPGVDVDGVGLNQARPIIRGQRGLRVLFLADGLRMNNPRRQTDFGEIPGLIDIDTVERVEVVRGPASVLYGSDAIGGVLNLVTRRPGALGSHGSLELAYGTAGEVGSAHATWNRRTDRWSLALDGSLREASDYDAPSGTFGDIRLDEADPGRRHGSRRRLARRRLPLRRDRGPRADAAFPALPRRRDRGSASSSRRRSAIPRTSAFASSTRSRTSTAPRPATRPPRSTSPSPTRSKRASTGRTTSASSPTTSTSRSRRRRFPVCPAS